MNTKGVLNPPPVAGGALLLEAWEHRQQFREERMQQQIDTIATPSTHTTRPVLDATAQPPVLVAGRGHMSGRVVVIALGRQVGPSLGYLTPEADARIGAQLARYSGL